MVRLEDRVAVVTGAGRGLGRAMALGLAAAGAKVVLTSARERAEVEAVAASIGADAALAVVADVTDEAACARVVEAAVARFGRLDILVNNAARGMRHVSEDFMTSPTRFWEVAPATWRMVVDTNVTGPFLMARAVVPRLLAAGWGRVINVSVSETTMRRAGFSPYGPSKAALESETLVWAQDLAGTGVTVNALLPGGATLTGMIPDAYPPQARAKLLAPEIVVPPLLWLVSQGADGVTGRRVDASKWAEGGASGVSDAGWRG